MKIKYLSGIVYPMLPVFLQNAACSYYGKQEAAIRFSKSFYRYFNDLLESEKWSASEIEVYQNARLRKLVKHAYDNVPYYRDMMKQLKLTPDDIKSRHDLHKLPILTKEEVRAQMRRLVASNVHKKELILKNTSGTTGKSLHFYTTREAIAFQWAIWWQHRQRFGIDFNTCHANFTGKLVVPPQQSRPPYWRWNKPMHQALINMHHIVPDKIRHIMDFLNKEYFIFYSGYPSIIHSLAYCAGEAGMELINPPKFIFTGAENILDYQRQDIETFTGAILSDQYGFAEGCGNASQCNEFLYHEDFKFGILECVEPSIDSKGRMRGKIVCTGFANYAFPFIRYEVGDIGVWERPDKCCKCGRQSSLIAGFEGRVEDYVITPEGRRIMRFDYIFKDTANVKEAQIVQDKFGEIKVRIIRRPTYTVKDEEFINDMIRKWISPTLVVHYEYPDEIEREKNGKFRAVRSLLQNKQQHAP